LQNKFFFNDKYDDFINYLYDEDILDKNDIDIIQNNKNNNFYKKCDIIDVIGYSY